jgi:hypothetical protein
MALKEKGFALRQFLLQVGNYYKVDTAVLQSSSSIVQIKKAISTPFTQIPCALGSSNL